jgi:isocitrate/isopropylmalate dehydrogenase
MDWKEQAVNTQRIAVIPGDGIGKEVVPEGLRVLDAVATRFDLTLQWDESTGAAITTSSTAG